MFRWHSVLVLLLVASTAQVALAQLPDLPDQLPGEDDPSPPTPDGALDEAKGQLPEDAPVAADTSLLDRILGGAGDLVSGVGDALADGVKGALSAVGDFFAFLWDGTVGAVVGIGRGLGVVGDGIWWSVTGVASLMGTLLTGTFRALGDGATAAWALLASAALGLASLRPEGMSEAAWAGTVATGATAASAAANLGLLNRLKKAGWLTAGAPLFTRIAKDDILDHPLRAEIFEAIKASPGIHISALARTVDAGWGTTIHHLRKLQEKELIAVRTVNNQKCYFHNGGAVTRSAWTQLPELKNETAHRIAQYVLARPLSPVTDVSDSLGISPSLVSHHVRKLERAGVLEKVRDGRFVKLVVPEAARATVFGEPTQAPVGVPTGIAA